VIERLIDETPVEPAFSAIYTFPFDAFQTEAMAEIRASRSVMVAAPTSSGKTVVAEYALWRALQRGTRAIYTTPIKALSNQKRRDLEAMFPGRVGLLTGDRSENPEAPIVVMTTEVLRNMLVEDGQSLDTVGCVVFDEVHYLADPDRGTVWEEAIIHAPAHIQLICLSATIQNAEEVAAWIGETHRPIALVRHDERPVPLEHYYYGSQGLQLVRDADGQRRLYLPREGKLRPPFPADLVRALERADLLPVIWFAFSRRGVEEAAAECARPAPRPSADAAMAIESEIAWALDLLPPEDRRLPQLSLLIRLLRRGVGFHHAGLLPPLKELVERLFNQGLLSVVCATDTLAVGINMPARTVVISSMVRPFGGMLSSNDFSQLTGRAGRRGIDDRGAVVMLPGPRYAFEEAYRSVAGPLAPILSAFRLRYSTLLTAVEGSKDRLGELVRASLRQYQMRAKARTATEELAGIRSALSGIAVDHEGLAEYLALQGELSQAEKEQKRARNARSKAPRSRSARTRYERARAERERLNAELRAHPAHGQAKNLEHDHPELIADLRRLNRLEGIVRQAQQECDREAIETAEAVGSVLEALGYVGKRGPTDKARGLREVVSPAGIVLSELYWDGALTNLPPADIAEVVSWFACDVNRRRDNAYRLPSPLFRLRHRAVDTYRRIAALEEAEGITLTQGPSDWFYGVARAWCRGASIGEIMRNVELSEGDVVSLLNKTVDLLDQLDDLLAAYGDVDMRGRVSEARRLLVRGLVALVRGDEESVSLAIS